MPIKVYTTPTCPWCKKAKEFLRSKGVAFQEVDVTKDRRLIEEMQELSGQRGVPVITDGERVVIGFNRQALEEMAGAAG